MPVMLRGVVKDQLRKRIFPVMTILAHQNLKTLTLYCGMQSYAMLHYTIVY